jgi:hypothetical protein
MQVAAYHNVALDPAGRHKGLVDGFQVEHPVSLVFATELSDQAHEAACEEVWRLLNVGHDGDHGTADPDAARYRERGNRSLSVGDVIAVDGVFYACGPNGWHDLRDVPTIVHRADVRGTVPLADSVATLAEFLAVYGRPGGRVEVVEAGPVAQQWPSLVVKAGDKAAVVRFLNVGAGTPGQHLCIDVHAFTAGHQGRASVFGLENGRRLNGFSDPHSAGTSHGWPAARLVAVLIGVQADTEAGEGHG